MGNEVTVGIISGAAGVLAAGVPSFLAGRSDAKKHDAERQRAREEDFGRFQWGARKAYEKFSRAVDAAPVGPDGRVTDEDALEDLRDYFFECRSAGDDAVREELDEWWPRALRRDGRLGDADKFQPVQDAMDAHRQRSLAEQDRLDGRAQK